LLLNRGSPPLGFDDHAIYRVPARPHQLQGNGAVLQHVVGEIHVRHALANAPHDLVPPDPAGSVHRRTTIHSSIPISTPKARNTSRRLTRDRRRTRVVEKRGRVAWLRPVKSGPATK